jgi:hypothetical protein
VNLFILGLIGNTLGTSQAQESKDSSLSTLKKIVEAVDKSGLKHNELWSYHIENGKLVPYRYGTQLGCSTLESDRSIGSIFDA